MLLRCRLGCRAWGSGRHAPNRVSHIVGDQQRAVPIHGETYRPTAGVVVRVKEAGHDILGDARGFAAAERDEYDLVAVERRAISASMLAHERAAPVVHGQINACVHGKSQWGNVGAEGIVGLDCSCHEVGPLRHDARIEMLAEVAVGPAVEAMS